VDVSCKRCQAAIPAEDVNVEHVERMVAKCRACNAVFDFSDQLEGALPAARTRGKVPLPERMRVVHGATSDARLASYRSSAGAPTEVTIEWRWFHPSRHLFMLLFAICWNAFLVFWYTTAFSGSGPWLVYVFPLGHVAVGVGIGYGALAGLLNKTTVAVSGRELIVRHGPLPWRGNHRIPASEVLQFYAVEKEDRGKNGVTLTYGVKAVMNGGRELSLVTKLTESGQALYLEQALETALGIADAPVAGELPR
jgi:hypothetical protein